jgi:hypothetical protein
VILECSDYGTTYTTKGLKQVTEARGAALVNIKNLLFYFDAATTASEMEERFQSWPRLD